MTKGVYTAIITPFLESGAIDWQAYESLIKTQVEAGVSGIVVTGTTGESPTLSKDEKKKIWEKTLELLKGTSLECVAGTGTNNTEETIEYTRLAQSLGYKKFLLVTPYYNKPTQEGLKQHYQKIANEVRGEIILYNVPGRTGVSLSAQTIAQLATHPQITALKEATGNLDFLIEIQNELKKFDAKMDLLSGDDATTLPFIKNGGVGCISVASIVAPQSMVELCKNKSESVHQKLQPLFRDLFIESNPGPVKFLLSEMGVIKNVLRLPLVGVTEETKIKLKKTMSLYQKTKGQLI